jgi:hypothetical protein
MRVERHARRHHQPRRASEVEQGRIVDDHAIDRLCPLPRRRIAVPRHDMRARRGERAYRRHAGSREAEYGVALALPGVGKDHRNFSVDRPASASTRLMIQKRITTVGSLQPSCSK